jgi:hypothetical protein
VSRKVFVVEEEKKQVEGSPHRLLLTFPQSVGAGQIFGVFSSEETFSEVRRANPTKKIVSEKMQGEQILHAMQQLSDPNAPTDARVVKLSIDGKLVFDWPKHEALWRRAVDTAWTRSTLQLATSSEEIDVACAQVLGPKGRWIIVEHLQPNGSYSIQGNDMNGKVHFLVFVDADIALRVFPDESKIRLREAENTGLANLAKKGTTLGLVHDCLDDGRIGFVSVDWSRLERGQKKLAQSKK